MINSITIEVRFQFCFTKLNMPIDSTVEEKLEAIRFILYQKKHLLHVQSPVIKGDLYVSEVILFASYLSVKKRQKPPKRRHPIVRHVNRNSPAAGIWRKIFLLEVNVIWWDKIERKGVLNMIQ